MLIKIDTNNIEDVLDYLIPTDPELREWIIEDIIELAVIINSKTDER